MDDELEGAQRVGLEPILRAPRGASSSWPGATIRSLDEVPELVHAVATNSLLRGR